MTAASWHAHLEAYVALRRAVGFAARPDVGVLRDFVAMLDQDPITGPTAAGTVAWAQRTGGAGTHARRLSLARQFLTYVQAFDPAIAVPGTGLLATPRRSPPRLLSATDIVGLIDRARRLRPSEALHPETIATVIGLLASCGLRAHEALRLTVDDVALTTDPPTVTIRESKFRKSRLVPLHLTTTAALQRYADRRHALGYDGLCATFFVGERGAPLAYHTLRRAFVALARDAGLRGPAGTRGLTLHHLRHTFAVTRLAAWAAAGLDVAVRLPTLAVYLGHARPQETYWYLTATTEILAPAAQRFETFAGAAEGAP